MSTTGDARVAVFLADGFEEIEGLTVVDLLRRAQISCTTISVHESPEIHGSHDITLRADSCLSDEDLSSYDVLVLPGGMPGTTHLANCAPLCQALVSHHAHHKLIAAICAAPSILAKLGILTGLNATSYPSYEEELLNQGANYCSESVVVDANVITSRGMGTALDFGLTIVKELRGANVAEQLSQSVIYSR